MQAYLNDPDFKAAFLVQIGKHEAADQLLKGTYGRMNGHFRGCAIGCALHSLNVLQGKPEFEKTDQHTRYEAELGIPAWLAYLEDFIFERLPDEAARTWPRQFAEAIPVGAVVTDRTLAQLLRWGLADLTFGARSATSDVAVVAIVDRMIGLFDRAIAGDVPTAAEWREAARAAWAARAARNAWAAWAARAAWDARAAWAARDAWDARAARNAWAAWDARDDDMFYQAFSAYALDLLRALAVDNA